MIKIFQLGLIKLFLKHTNDKNSYSIVVGTFKYKRNAEKQLVLIEKKYPKTTKNKESKVVALKSKNGHLYESRFRFFSKEEAIIACSRLKKYNRGCFIR